MANTYVDYTGDGSETDFNFSFPYINTEHVAVEVNEGPAGGTNRWVRKTLTDDYTVETTPNNFVRFVTAPTNLTKIRVLRDSNATVAIVDFENGSVLTETELDNGYNHNRYLAEEAEEGATGGALTKRDTDHYNADGLKLENLADPDSDDDAVNKGYADNRYVDVAGDTMTGALDMGSNKVTSSATPSTGNDLTNKTYTDNTFVDASGDSMSGDLNMGANDILSAASVQGLSTPVSDDYAANKGYVDDQDDLQVTKSGDSMSGNLTMTSPNKVVQSQAPTSGNDLTNKTYVDQTVTTSLATGSPPPGVQLGTTQIEDDAITADKLDNTTVTPGSYTNTDLTVDENGRITAASNGSGGAGATNLSNTPAASSVDIESSTGTNTTVAGATTSLAGVMTGADKTKLDGVATGATANTGTVTSVGSGTGLTGGPITSSGTLSIANDGVGTAQIAANAVTSTEISDSDTTFKVAASEVAVNDGGADVDFRVEGDTDANLINTNAAEDTVGIGSAGSSSFKLNVDGGTAKSNVANFQADNASGTVAAFIKNASATGINSILQIVANTGSNLTSSVNLDLQSNVGVNEYFQIGFNNADLSGFRFTNSNTGSTSTAAGAFHPGTNGYQDLGLTGNRWDDVWSAGTFNGSDQNIKQDIEDLDEAEKRVAVKCKGLIKKYRMKDAVAKKGNDARIHVGIIAQELQAAFESEGLDAFRYSMIGKDTWWEKIDENGQRLVNYKETLGYTKVTQMSVRYNELLAFIIAAM